MMFFDRVMLQIVRTANGGMVLPPPRGDAYPEWPDTYVFTDAKRLAEWIAEWAQKQEQPAA